MVLLVGLAACTEEDYKVYDTTQKDAVFFEFKDNKDRLSDSLKYEFQFDLATVHTVEIPVTLMGMPSNHDRIIKLVPVAEETTMVEGVHYTIDNAVLPANATQAIVKVNLLRENDPKLQEEEFTLRLEIAENDDLRPVGSHIFKIVYSDIRPGRPAWWSTISSYALPEYSFKAAQYFFDYFYREAPAANLEVYDEMIERYGDYFVDAVEMQGPLAMYTNFIKRYVLIPMYNDMQNGVIDELEWVNVPSF